MRRLATGDQGFYATVLRLAGPLATQQFVMNALNAIDVLMIGQKGETAVAAVGLANQVSFLLNIFLFGVGSGAAIFSAQYWGRRDLAGVRKVLGLGLLLGLAGSSVFALAAVCIPSTILRLYTADPAVADLGSRYLRIVGLGYLPTGATVMYGMVLRSTRHVKAPMVVSVAALSLKTLLAYGLIFGKAGLPELGVAGAASATAIARVIECASMLAVTYARRLPAAAGLAEMRGQSREFLGRFARTALPVVVGEILWSLSTTAYAAVYARVGTAAVAAVNIAGTVEQIALVPFMALSNAAAIMIGNRIGADEAGSAHGYARRFMIMSIAGAWGIGLLMFACAAPALSLYRVSADTQHNGLQVLTVLSGALWIKAANIMTIVGILRSGGDTRFALFADTAPGWLIGVPMALLGGLVLRLPIQWVVLMVLAEEATKCVIAGWRVLSGGWIHNVVRPSQGVS